MRGRSLFFLLLSSLSFLLVAACGKKGPPLPPFVHIPAAVGQIAARRVGNDVYVSVTVPARNLDNSTPAALSRLEIWAYTGRTPPTPRRWPFLGTLVARVPVMALGPEAEPSRGTGEPMPAPFNQPAIAGSVITIRDQLTADELVEAPVPVDPSVRPPPPPAPVTAAAARAPQAPLRRFYMALAFSGRERPSPPGVNAEITLTPVPDPPASLSGSYSLTGLTLNWAPSGGTLGFVTDRELPPEPPPFDEYEDLPAVGTVPTDKLPPPPTLYNVYREQEPDPFELLTPATGSVWNAPAPKPINPAPTPLLTMTDPLLVGRRACYTVRAVRGAGPAAVESEPSAPLCVMPVDVFPPAPPRSLAAVPAANAINLIWEASDELDAAGYLVLRGEPGDATLHTLTPLPVTEARYRDASVKAGVTYVYAVVAVDSRLPLPNVSAESNRVQETAR